MRLTRAAMRKAVSFAGASYNRATVSRELTRGTLSETR